MKPRDRVNEKRVQLMQNEGWAPSFLLENITSTYDSLITRLAIIELFIEDKNLLEEFQAWSVQLQRKDKLEVIHGKKN
jgi:hypothetical protein